jgi:hypothetical protein
MADTDVEAAAATSSFGPAEATLASDKNMMVRVNLALAAFKEKLMMLSPLMIGFVPSWLRYAEG